MQFLLRENFMILNNRSIQRTYSFPPDILDKLEELYIDSAVKKLHMSRSGIVAAAISELWSQIIEKK